MTRTSLLMVALCVLGCSKGDKTDKAGGAEEKKAPAPAALTDPKALGERVAGEYTEMMAKVVGLIEGNPAIADVKPKLEALRDEYIQKWVPAGKQRASFDDAGRAAMDLALRMGIEKLPPEKLQAFANATNGYRAQDNAFAEWLIEFNILTQYSNYELLKKQRPDEAKRLGID